MSDAPYRIRAMREGDLAFVKNAWLESYKARALAKITREIDKLARGAQVRVACDREDDDALFGFAATSDATLHYAYVRESLRNEGIARDLLGSEPIEAYSFRTDVGETRLKPAERGWAYRPRIIL